MSAVLGKVGLGQVFPSCVSIRSGVVYRGVLDEGCWVKCVRWVCCQVCLNRLCWPGALGQVCWVKCVGSRVRVLQLWFGSTAMCGAGLG